MVVEPGKVALRLSEKTVRNHVSQVLLKLQVPDRTAAALKAREAGLPGADVQAGDAGRDRGRPYLPPT